MSEVDFFAIRRHTMLTTNRPLALQRGERPFDGVRARRTNAPLVGQGGYAAYSRGSDLEDELLFNSVLFGGGGGSSCIVFFPPFSPAIAYR